MINTIGGIRQKRELLRLQIRKQYLHDEFSKKRNISLAQINPTPIDEILNQIFTISQKPLTSETLITTLTLITGHQDIVEILKKTEFLKNKILEFFCEGFYDVNNVKYFLLYFDSLLLFDDLAYLEIKIFDQKFMNNLKLILQNPVFYTVENVRTIINIFQSLLIDCPTIFSQFIHQQYQLNDNLLSIMMEISQKQQSNLIQQSMIELAFHIVRFYRFEDDIPTKIISQLAKFYFSIIDLSCNMNEIELLPLYVKSGKYLVQICDSYDVPVFKFPKFKIYLQVLCKFQDMLPNFQEDKTTNYYSAKVIQHLWRYLIRIMANYDNGMIILLQKIIINESFQISQIGLETLKEIIEEELPNELLYTLLNNKFEYKNTQLNLLDWLIQEITNKEESLIKLMLEVIGAILKNNTLKLILVNKDIFSKFKDILTSDYHNEILLEVIEILTSLVLDDSIQSFKLVNFPLILKNLCTKNQMLTYKIDNLLQLCELQE